MRTTILATLIVLGLIACADTQTEDTALDERVPVRVLPVERRALTHTMTLSGRLRANEVVEIQPEVGGRIVAFRRHEGDRVHKGDLLVELDATDIRLELERAEAALSQAKARQTDARRKLERAQELFAEGALSQASLDSTAVESQIAHADVQRATADRNLVRERIRDTRITAPMDGTLQERGYAVGDIVTPGMGGARREGDPGTALFTLIQTDPVVLDVRISEQDIGQTGQIDDEVHILVDSYPGEDFVGVVDYVAPSLDPGTYTQTIRLRIANPDGRLKPGMFARTESIRDVAEDALVVPADALIDLGDVLGVYVVDDDIAHLRQVRPRFVTGNEAAIDEGLREGELVIVEGQSTVREGTAVRQVNPAGAGT